MMGWLFFLVCECRVGYIKWTPRFTCLNCLLTLRPAVGERDSWNIFRGPSRSLIVGYTLVITRTSSCMSPMATLSDVRIRTVILSVGSQGGTSLRSLQLEECRLDCNKAYDITEVSYETAFCNMEVLEVSA